MSDYQNKQLTRRFRRNRRLPKAGMKRQQLQQNLPIPNEQQLQTKLTGCWQSRGQSFGQPVKSGR